MILNISSFLLFSHSEIPGHTRQGDCTDAV